MIEETDGFVALLGGYGTLDEVLEVISMKALGVLSAPLVLVNVDDAWNPVPRADRKPAPAWFPA